MSVDVGGGIILDCQKYETSYYHFIENKWHPSISLSKKWLHTIWKLLAFLKVFLKIMVSPSRKLKYENINIVLRNWSPNCFVKKSPPHPPNGFDEKSVPSLINGLFPPLHYEQSPAHIVHRCNPYQYLSQLLKFGLKYKYLMRGDISHLVTKWGCLNNIWKVLQDWRNNTLPHQCILTKADIIWSLL